MGGIVFKPFSSVFMHAAFLLVSGTGFSVLFVFHDLLLPPRYLRLLGCFDFVCCAVRDFPGMYRKLEELPGPLRGG